MIHVELTHEMPWPNSLDWDGLAVRAARAAIDRAAADDWQTRGRAHYVLGMLAADAGDSGALAQAIAAMGAKPDPALQADRRELQGRQLALGGEHGGAVAAFGQAAALRRELRDYVGMARVLAAAGASAERTGDDAGAADYYYRAGRSAAAQDDADNARSWLATARKLAARGGQPRIAADAGQLLSTLGE